MPDSDFAFVSGEPLQFGTEGQNEVAFHKGEPLPDRGGESYIFESGVALGGQLVRQYKFDEKSGNTAIDSTGTNDATIGSAVTLGASGIDGTAFKFTPSSSNSIVENRDDNISFQDLTVAAWVNLEAKNNADKGVGNPVQQIYEQENNVELFIDENDPNSPFSDTLRWRVTAPGVSTTDATTSAPFGSYTHVIGSYQNDTNESVLYIDGNEVDRVTSSESVNIDGSFTIGREFSDSEGDQRANGLIDDVRIYQTFFNPSDASDLYDSYF